jgi:hypothetical protein
VGRERTLLLGAGSIALLFAFLVREARAASPLIRCGSSARARFSPRSDQILSVAGMFGMFFRRAVSAAGARHDALRIGLAFLPSRSQWGRSRSRYSERLLMAFGARRTLLGG